MAARTQANGNRKKALGLASAEQRLKERGIQFPAPPEPFGTYSEAVQTGNLLFLTGMLPTEGRAAKFIGAGRRRASTSRPQRGLPWRAQWPRCRSAASGIARQSDTDYPAWGLGCHSERFRDHPKVADGASALLQDVFGKDKNPSRLVYGVASLPLGTPVELELIFEVSVLPLPPRNSRSSLQKRFARASGHCANSGAEESRSHFRQPAYLWSA